MQIFKAYLDKMAVQKAKRQKGKCRHEGLCITCRVLLSLSNNAEKRKEKTTLLSAIKEKLMANLSFLQQC